ncbi:MAG: carotenoid biosynthesis protein [Bacteroidales bacterium]|nr:carotenoid biosynthesis protein [Bacteroidales bacterium]
MNNRISISKIDYKFVIGFFIFFYSVGIAGILTPRFSDFFISTTSFALIISFIALIIFHKESWSTKAILVFSFIAILGFFVEVIGVNTGLIFGEYSYGNSLGIKIFNTPIMIAFNWLLMIYTSAAIAQKWKFHPIITILFGAALMVVYDMLLEPVAPKLDMWTWVQSSAPLQNYLAWALISIAFHALLQLNQIKIYNKLAPAIYLTQFGFFLILNALL